MVLVNEKRKIYVCGGRYIDTEKGEVKESGWYIYDISNGSWTTFGPLLHESARFGMFLATSTFSQTQRIRALDGI